MEIPEGRIHGIAGLGCIIESGSPAQLVHQIDRVGRIEQRTAPFGAGAVIELPLQLGTPDRLAITLNDRAAQG